MYTKIVELMEVRVLEHIMKRRVCMKIQTNQETVDAIKSIVEQQADQPSNIRIYIAGMG